MRLDTGGISSRDWESYPVLRFSEVPEVLVELVNPSADLPPLGVGEASGGPTVAAIGNAVAHALGARLRDLPLTRDRVISAESVTRACEPHDRLTTTICPAELSKL